MKLGLEYITLEEFIAIMEGDISPIRPQLISMPTTERRHIVQKLALDYQAIADNAGVVRFLNKAKKEVIARMGVNIFTICKHLIVIGHVDDVKSILCEYGIRVDNMNEQRLKTEVEMQLARNKDALRRLEDDDDRANDCDIRHQFDMQTAALMAHFKFQIDTKTIKASVYAHLVSQYRAEVKAIIDAHNKQKY